MSHTFGSACVRTDAITQTPFATVRCVGCDLCARLLFMMHEYLVILLEFNVYVIADVGNLCINVYVTIPQPYRHCVSDSNANFMWKTDHDKFYLHLRLFLVFFVFSFFQLVPESLLENLSASHSFGDKMKPTRFVCHPQKKLFTFRSTATA